MANLNVELKFLAAANVDLPAKVQQLVDTRHAVMTATSSSGEHGRLVADIQAGNLDASTVADRLRQAAAERVTGTAHSAIAQDLAGRLEQQILTELSTAESCTHVTLALRPLFAEAVEIYQTAHDLGISDQDADELAKSGSAAVIANARLADAYEIMQRVELARKVATGSYLEPEDIVALDSVKPSRKTGGLSHQWASCIEDCGTSIPSVLAASMTPRLNLPEEAVKVKLKAEVPPIRVQTQADLDAASREAAEDRSDARRAAHRTEQREAGRKTA